MYGLSGFLGLPTDWDCFEGIQGVNAISEIPENKIVVGYSLGGRKTLQALINKPHHFLGAVLISAHPGLTTHEEREQRMVQDQKWADRFRRDSWDLLMKEWNDQPVFGNHPSPFVRYEKDYHREELAQTLVRGSLAKQPDLRPAIAALPMPILWITGLHDNKFTSISHSISLSHPLSKKVVMPLACHRVPWENSHDFQNTLSEFTGALYDSHLRREYNMDND